MWHFKRKERVFHIRFTIIGYMGNEQFIAEFTGPVSNWEMKHNGVHNYFWFKNININKKWLYKDKIVLSDITEIKG